MLLSGAFLLALVAARRRRRGHATAAPATVIAGRQRRPIARPPQPQRHGERGRLQPAGGQSGGPVEQPAAGAVGDGRLDAGPAEPGRVRARSARAARGTRALPTIPPGALLAAMNLWAEGTAVPASELFQRLRGGRADEPRQQRASWTQMARSSSPATATTPTRPSQAQVAVVFQGPEGKLLAVVTSMVWQAATGSTLFPAGGTPAMQVIADLTGYVPWSSF